MYSAERRLVVNTENQKFDFQQAVKDLQAGKPLFCQEGFLTPLVKSLPEAAFEGKFESHLGKEVTPNRRNGKSKKTIQSMDGNFEFETPRNRASTFLPQLVKKHQTTITDEIEQKLIALYGLGMSYNDISAHLKGMYGVAISNSTLNAETRQDHQHSQRVASQTA